MRTKYLCTTCRIAMSRIARKERVMKCGRCGSDLSFVHHKFRAPPSRDVKFWSVIKYLEDAGMIRVLDRGFIPKRMSDARAIVAARRERDVQIASPYEVRKRQEKAARSATINRKRALAQKARRWRTLAQRGRI